MEEMTKHGRIGVAAMKADMDAKTARKYVRAGKLPSEMKGPRDWRTRQDPFEEHWPEVTAMLREQPGLEVKTVFEVLSDKYPGRYEPGQLRTLQRRVRLWRGLHGPDQEVYFPQVHYPGIQAQSDFTSMNGLEIQIEGRRFPHLLYHFVLTYSNWEYVEICGSESFEALQSGLQNALWVLGRVPEEHRTDNLTAATFKGRSRREFNEAYLGLVRHYGMRPSRNHPGEAHQNGDVEQSHWRVKERVDQTLLLRGNRNFESRTEYGSFLKGIFETKNQDRRKRVEEELAVMAPLPSRRLEDYREYQVRVSAYSTVLVAHNIYSAPSRLSRHEVLARLYADRVEIYFAGQCVAQMERLRGKGRATIDYRHVIGSLSRKPGAFQHYRYREELFPSTVYRQAYDWLLDHDPVHASRRYLAILEWAASNSEAAMETALREHLDEGRELYFAHLIASAEQPLEPAFDFAIPLPDLDRYDALLEGVAP